MIPPEALHLRHFILTAAQARGVRLEVHCFGLEHHRPALRLRLGGKILRGCWVGLPDAPNAPCRADVITVHGSGHRSSRMWPRKTDGTFRIDAITDHILTFVGEEPVEIPAARAGEDARRGTSSSGVLHGAGKHRVSVTRLSELPHEQT